MKIILQVLPSERQGRETTSVWVCNKYAKNLNQLAQDGKLDPVIGREKEINDVTAILSRRGKNNPVLLGEPGVGKTAVTEGLAIIIIKQSGPDFLDGSVVIGLDLGSVLAGTKYRGEFEIEKTWPMVCCVKANLTRK